MHIKFSYLLAVTLDLLSTSTANPAPSPATTVALETCLPTLDVNDISLVQPLLMCCSEVVAGVGINCTSSLPCLLVRDLSSHSETTFARNKRANHVMITQKDGPTFFFYRSRFAVESR